MAQPRCLVELRVLDGPNVHLDHPAIQLRLDARKLLRGSDGEAAAWAAEIGLDHPPGPAGTPARVAFATAWLRRVTHRLAALGGVRGLNVVTAPGHGDGEVIVAFPWSRERRATTLGRWVAWCLDDAGRQPLVETFEEAEPRLRRASGGPRPRVPDPTVPTVAVTGTNGKTTTTRLLAFLAMACRRRVAWNSTDGVYTANETLDGAVLVEAGDWAGFGGAARVLDTRGLEVAVIEVARGGLLRRGMGVRAVDVGVVTNVAADHMGEMGVHTLDQLARVKSTVARAVRADGWAVLNAEDERVLAMRPLVAGRTIAFARDSSAPGVAAVLAEGGRAVTVVDDAITLLSADGDAHRLVDVAAVPITLAGLSRPNLANALAATAAAWGLGLPLDGVAQGLRAFTPDAQRNPGRLNAYLVPAGGSGSGVDRLVLVDIAHNPDSLRGLCEVARGVTADGRRLWAITGSIGDRSEEIMIEMGQTAASLADRVVIAEKGKYLRGRDPDEVLALLRAGAAKAGLTEVPSFRDEVDALDAVLADAGAGDVVAFAVHVHLPDIGQLMADRDAVTATSKDISRWAGSAQASRAAR